MSSNSQDRNIYVTLLSNDSTKIFKNTPNTFTNLLKQPLNLNDQWVVGLSDISFSLQDFNKKNDQNNIKRSLQKSSSKGGKPKKAKLNNDDEEDIIKNKFKKLLHSTLENDAANRMFNRDSLKIPDEIKPVLNIDDKKITNVFKDTKDITNKSNDENGKAKDGTNIELKNDKDEPLLALTNNFLENSLNRLLDDISDYFNKIIAPEVNDIIFIYTDIIKPRHVGNNKTKCIKIFSISSLKNYINFSRVDYFPLETFNINDISIMIRNDEGRELNLLEVIPVYCTLHFKKI